MFRPFITKTLLPVLLVTAAPPMLFADDPKTSFSLADLHVCARETVKGAMPNTRIKTLRTKHGVCVIASACKAGRCNDISIFPMLEKDGKISLMANSKDTIQDKTGYDVLTSRSTALTGNILDPSATLSLSSVSGENDSSTLHPAPNEIQAFSLVMSFTNCMMKRSEIGTSSLNGKTQLHTLQHK